MWCVFVLHNSMCWPIHMKYCLQRYHMNPQWFHRDMETDSSDIWETVWPVSVKQSILQSSGCSLPILERVSVPMRLMDPWGCERLNLTEICDRHHAFSQSIYTQKTSFHNYYKVYKVSPLCLLSLLHHKHTSTHNVHVHTTSHSCYNNIHRGFTVSHYSQCRFHYTVII